MRIRLSALDTLFFKDGKPFNKGDETWANGIFPPAPSVLYGALRSLYFTTNPAEIGKENTSQDVTKQLVINDIKIVDNHGTYYVCPNDVVINKKNKEEVVLLKMQKTSTITSSCFNHHLYSQEEVEDIDGFLLQEDFEEDYLNGQEPLSFIKKEKLISLEPKVGIGRDDITRIAKDGLLYRVGMIRLKNIMIEVDFDLNNWILDVGYKGFIKIGGEGKTCSFEVLAPSRINKIDTISSDIFKIYIASPTIFNNHQIKTKKNGQALFPNFLDENFEGQWNGLKVKLLTAAVGKPKYIGGFDMKKREPKPMLKMIPEGSIFYFKILDNKQHFKPLSQPFKFIDNVQKEKEGFGLAYLANIKS